ncbi:MAG TPA: hypothetical protein VFX61_00925 [Micromonosporaceae bacterium]|nr:hypothetical protein [Micromonosporaceae bacterium]
MPVGTASWRVNETHRRPPAPGIAAPLDDEAIDVRVRLRDETLDLDVKELTERSPRRRNVGHGCRLLTVLAQDPRELVGAAPPSDTHARHQVLGRLSRR